MELMQKAIAGVTFYESTEGHTLIDEADFVSPVNGRSYPNHWVLRTPSKEVLGHSCDRHRVASLNGFRITRQQGI
jgi:hypothetical protein